MAPFGAAAGDGGDGAGGIPDFERLRLAHVERTAEYLASLDLPGGAGSPAAAPARLRRSSATGAGEPETPAPKRARRSEEAAAEAPWARESAAEAEVVEASRHWLRASRAALLRPGLGGDPPASKEAWRQEALRRWGGGVPAGDLDWELYVRSRLPTPPPPSPLDIMQERYAYDAWRLLAACTLMARISSEKVKEETIAAFFRHCPSPSRLMEASGGAEARRELEALLKPLGLVDGRLKTLAALSQAFLEMPAFDVGHKKNVNKIWGCGAFAVDSFRIFCRAEAVSEVADDSCRSYVEWWLKAGGGPDGVSKPHLPTPPKQKGEHGTGGGPALPAETVKQGGGLLRFFKPAAV